MKPLNDPVVAMARNWAHLGRYAMGECKECKWWHRWQVGYPRGTCKAIVRPGCGDSELWRECGMKLNKENAELHAPPLRLRTMGSKRGGKKR